MFLGFGLFLFINKDFIKNQTINALNAQLDAHVDVKGEIALIFFSTFPQINLSFNDVVIEDKLRINDTLARIGNLSLSLNPWSILKKNYTIEGIEASNGFLHLYTDKNSRSNYDILKPSESEQRAPSILKLKKIYLSNLSIGYLDQLNNTHIELFTKSSTIKGSFYEQDFDLIIDTKLLNQKIKINEVQLLQGKNISGKLKLRYSGENACIIFNDNALIIENNVFNIEGSICNKTKVLDLVAKADGDDLKNALSLIPNEWFNSNSVKGNGQYSLNASIKGSFNNPIINLDFSIDKGKLNLEEENLQLQNLSILGNYSNAKNSTGSLIIHAFSASSGSSSLSGSFNIPKLDDMLISAQLDGNLDFDLIKNYVPEIFMLNSGKLGVKDLNLSLYQNQEDSLWSLKKIEGIIALDSLKGKILSLGLPFSCHGQLTGKENYLIGSNLNLRIGQNHLHFDGQILNLLGLILNKDNQDALDLGIKGILTSTYFNLNDFISKENNLGATENKAPSLPPINGDLKIDIEKFIYKKLEISDLKIIAFAENTSYRFNINEAKTLGGSFKGFLLSNVKGNDFEVNLSCDIQKVNIQAMFEAFDNFGQESMGSQNVKGTLQSELSMSAIWKNFSEFDSKSFMLQSHIELLDGELVNFLPLLSLAGKLEIEQLEHLYFTDLSTNISIKDEVIHMPMTEIQTNLLSLKVGGTHTFENEIDYSLILNLKNLLAAKFKKKRTTEEDYVNDAQGGINLYIKMSGTVDNPLISYDRSSVKDKIKNDFKEEKQEFKNLFKKEEESEFEKNEFKFEELKEEDKFLEWED
jgi:hypothetical protein